MDIGPSLRLTHRQFLTFSVVFISNAVYQTPSTDDCQKDFSGAYFLVYI